VVVDNIAAAVAAAVAAEVDNAMMVDGCGDGAETKMVEAMEVKVVRSRNFYR
jgi:hypothetical protein